MIKELHRKANMTYKSNKYVVEIYCGNLANHQNVKQKMNRYLEFHNKLAPYSYCDEQDSFDGADFINCITLGK